MQRRRRWCGLRRGCGLAFTALSSNELTTRACTPSVPYPQFYFRACSIFIPFQPSVMAHLPYVQGSGNGITAAPELLSYLDSPSGVDLCETGFVDSCSFLFLFYSFISISILTIPWTARGYARCHRAILAVLSSKLFLPSFPLHQLSIPRRSTTIHRQGRCCAFLQKAYAPDGRAPPNHASHPLSPIAPLLGTFR